jgi:Recombination endonuclease VII
MILKRCPDCGQEKPLEMFGVNRSRPDGLAHYCKDCFRARAARSYRQRRQNAGFVVREVVVVPDGHKFCRSCERTLPVTEFSVSRRQRDGLNSQCKQCKGARQRVHRLQRIYGLSAEDVQSRIDEQGGLCALCRERPAEHVDHDHQTGRVRGVLCFLCNVGLGQFTDRPDLLRRAIDYLETTTWQRTQVCTGVYRLTSPRLAARRSPSSSATWRLTSCRVGGPSLPD